MSGGLEFEFWVRFPGRVLPRDRWTRTMGADIAEPERVFREGCSAPPGESRSRAGVG
jgi:hypothetical protein